MNTVLIAYAPLFLYYAYPDLIATFPHICSTMRSRTTPLLELELCYTHVFVLWYCNILSRQVTSARQLFQVPDREREVCPS